MVGGTGEKRPAFVTFNRCLSAVCIQLLTLNRVLISGITPRSALTFSNASAQRPEAFPADAYWTPPVAPRMFGAVAQGQRSSSLADQRRQHGAPLERPMRSIWRACEIAPSRPQSWVLAGFEVGSGRI